jgi:hypothetical protein
MNRAGLSQGFVLSTLASFPKSFLIVEPVRARGIDERFFPQSVITAFRPFAASSVQSYGPAKDVSTTP